MRFLMVTPCECEDCDFEDFGELCYRRRAYWEDESSGGNDPANPYFTGSSEEETRKRAKTDSVWASIVKHADAAQQRK